MNSSQQALKDFLALCPMKGYVNYNVESEDGMSHYEEQREAYENHLEKTRKAFDKKAEPWQKQLLTSKAATSQQQKPKVTGVDIVPLVNADLQARMRMGIKKYGVALQAGNGRNALWDAYQEALDLACYLRQRIEEESTSK